MLTTALHDLFSSAANAPASFLAPIGWDHANAFALLPFALATVGWLALVAGVALHRRSYTVATRLSVPTVRRAPVRPAQFARAV